MDGGNGWRVKYRAQAKGVNGWVDGALFGKRERAEAAAARLARQYGVPTRVVEIDTTDEPDSGNTDG